MDEVRFVLSFALLPMVLGSVGWFKSTQRCCDFCEAPVPRAFDSRGAGLVCCILNEDALCIM